MQPHREVRFDASKDDLRASWLDERRFHASELPPALRRELIEQLRKADRPILASMPPSY